MIRILLLINILLISNVALEAQNSTAVSENDIPIQLFNKISISVKNVPLSSAFQMIAFKAGFGISYNNDSIPSDKRVSVAVRNKPAISVLMKLLNQTGTGLTITPNGQIVIIISRESPGIISGVIVNGSALEPLEHVNVALSGMDRGSVSDSSGHFYIPQLSPGLYSLEVSCIGFRSKTVSGIRLGENDSTAIKIEMEEISYSLEEIVVAAGHFSLINNQTQSVTSLTAEDIKYAPGSEEDIFRVAARLPGLTGSDFSSKFRIRGGEQEEMLVLLDGQELSDPFHLKDYGGMLSIIDVEGVDKMDIYSGGFNAQYGNKLSGVFSIMSRTPPREVKRHLLSVNLTNVKFLSEGNFFNNNGKWLIVGRRSYVDILQSFLDPNDNNELTRPGYNDIFAKFQYMINKDHLARINILHSNDLFKENTHNSIMNDSLASKYRNTYLWSIWDAQFSENISARTQVSTGNSQTERHGKKNSSDVTNTFSNVKDIRSNDFFDLKQDWLFRLSDNLIIKTGYEAKINNSDYDYSSSKNYFTNAFRDSVQLIVSRDIQDYEQEFSIKGNRYSAYLSNRINIISPLTVELGIRYDRATWTNDKPVSPRMNVAYSLGRNTTVRAGWGKYYQIQDINDLSIQDEVEIFYPAEKSTLYLTGLEHTFRNGIKVRSEVYYKKLDNIRPKYKNYRNQIDILPEVARDRYTYNPDYGMAKGIELLVKNDVNASFRWWCSYSYSRIEDNVANMMVPRDFDQRHSLYLESGYSFGNNWNLNLSWQFHSGWPFTVDEVSNVEFYPDNLHKVSWVHGAINSRRLPDYHRMDIKLSKEIEMENSRASAFLEIRNLYNRKNIRSFETTLQIQDQYNYQVIGTEQYGLCLLPSFGITIEF